MTNSVINICENIMQITYHWNVQLQHGDLFPMNLDVQGGSSIY